MAKWTEANGYVNDVADEPFVYVRAPPPRPVSHQRVLTLPSRSLASRRYGDGTTTPPVDRAVPFEEKNLVGAGLTTVGTLLVFGNYAIAAIFAFLTMKYQTHKVIRASQPMFLMLILVGCCVSTTAILFFGQDDGGDYANDGDINCMLQPIFYSLGFTFSFAALFAKITRISKIFGNKRLQKITITWVDMMKPIVALLVVDALLLILGVALLVVALARLLVGGGHGVRARREQLGVAAVLQLVLVVDTGLQGDGVHDHAPERRDPREHEHARVAGGVGRRLLVGAEQLVRAPGCKQILDQQV